MVCILTTAINERLEVAEAARIGRCRRQTVVFLHLQVFFVCPHCRAVASLGMRLPDCEKYKICLTEAARLDAGGLACRSCQQYRQKDSLMLYHDEIDGILALLLALTDETEPAPI